MLLKDFSSDFSWREIITIIFMATSVILISMIINLNYWFSILKGMNYSHTLYSYSLHFFSPFYLQVVFVIVSTLGTYLFLTIIIVLGLLVCLLLVDYTFCLRRNEYVLTLILPSFFLFFMSLSALCVFLILLSLIMMLDNRTELGIFLYGISVALNLTLIILLPLYLYCAKDKMTGTLLAILPLTMTLGSILYYAIVMDASISLWGGRTNSLPLFVNQIISHMVFVFGGPELMIILSTTAIIGTVVGIVVSKIVDFRETDKLAVIFLVTLFEMEVIMPNPQLAPIGIPIHMMLIFLLLKSKMRFRDIIIVDSAFAISSIIISIATLLMYKIVLILLVGRFIYRHIFGKSEFLGVKKTEMKPIMWTFTQIKEGIIRACRRFEEIVHKKTIRQKIMCVCKYIFLYLITLTYLLYNFTTPKSIVFDEYHYVNAAREIIREGRDPRIEHPPLVKYLIVIGILLFGDNSFGWRLLIIIISALIIPATFYIAEKLLKSKKAATIATIFLLFDPLFYVQSRLAMLDGPALAFSTLGIASLVKYSEKKGKEIKWLYLTGLFVGIAISCKMTSLVPIIVALSLAPFPKRKHETLHLAIALLIVPCMVFSISYIPLFMMAVKIVWPESILEMLILAIIIIIVYVLWIITTVGVMFSVYQRLSATQPEIESHAWEWILGWKPIRAYAAIKYVEVIYMSMILEMANPVGWVIGFIIIITLGSTYVICGVVIFLSNAIYRKGKNKYKDVLLTIKQRYDRIAIILLWGLLAWIIYLPASLAHWFNWYYTRGTNKALDIIAQVVYSLFKEGRPHYIFYVYHMLPSMYILLAYVLERVDKKLKIPLSVFLLLLSLLFFALVYPVISGATWVQYDSIVGLIREEAT